MAVFSDELVQVVWETVKSYSQLISGITLGLAMAGIYQRFVTIGSVKKAYERLIAEKDARLADVRAIVYDRLNGIEVEQVNKSFFKKVCKYFRRNVKVQ
ncbi:MAG: hypothetical protein RBS07_15860 [Lentimicrobium sp.]|jgi:hypothetical protein|nr:hypothetical protein [Lentimicrobium sp.]